MIGKGATPSFFAIANDNYTLTIPKPVGKSDRFWYSLLIFTLIESESEMKQPELI